MLLQWEKCSCSSLCVSTLYFSLLLKAIFSLSPFASCSSFQFHIFTFYSIFPPKVPTESYLSQLSWQDSPLYTEMQPEKRLSQTEPPCPPAGQQPLQVNDLWEQYSDPSTGRSYYVNSVTKERSWKPPRRARGRTPTKVARWLEKMVPLDFYSERIESLGVAGIKLYNLYYLEFFLWSLTCGHIGKKRMEGRTQKWSHIHVKGSLPNVRTQHRSLLSLF